MAIYSRKNFKDVYLVGLIIVVLKERILTRRSIVIVVIAISEHLF